MRRLVGLAALGGGLLLAAHLRATDRAAPGRSVRAPDAVIPHAVPAASNILPRDYVGPESCRGCHAERYAQWRTHPHSKMNQLASELSVRGDFSGVHVAFQGGEVTFDKDGASYRMTLARGATRRRYVVTRTVGSRFMQFYIGRLVEGPEPAGHAAYTAEQKLPFGYWFKLARWLPTSYFDPIGAETLPDGSPAFDPFDRPRIHFYAANCMLCHNTYPYVYRLALPDGLCGLPSDDLKLDQDAIAAAIEPTLGKGAGGVRERLDPDRHLVTVGISCESCHFGGREHALDDGEAAYLPTSPHLSIAPKSGRKPLPKATDPYTVNSICAQCHRANITRYPNGAGTWNSREALDQAEGACKGAIKCTDCHDPHKPSGPEAAPDQPRAASCVRCHEKLAAPAARDAHARHPASAASCLDCHMPRATQGLEEVVRTHRIVSPVEPSMVAAGAWNACNLCHLDRSLAWTLDELEKGWGKKVARDPALAGTYGKDLAAPVGRVWLSGKDASTRLVTTQAYARSPHGRDALDALIAALDDPVAVNRVFATFAVERVTGSKLPLADYDVTAPVAERAKQVERLRERHRSR